MITADGPSTTTGLQRFIDSHSMSGRQYLLVVLGFLATLLDGLDVTAASFVYPQLVKQWHTPVSTITAIVTVGTIGMAIGAAIAGPLADRIGRHRVVVGAIALFGVFTALAVLAPNEVVFLVFRVVACLGLGAILPTIVTLVAEFTPQKSRATAVTVAFTGLAAGLAVGGYLAAAVVPALGWQALMLISGIIPLILVPLYAFLVPESVTFLALRGHAQHRIRKTLAALVPGADLDAVDYSVPASEKAAAGGVAMILSRSYLAVSLLLWACYFVGLGVIYLLLNYLPLIVESSGLSTTDAGYMVGLFGWGTIAGSLVVGVAQQKFGRFRVVAIVWLLGSAAVWAVTAFHLGYGGLLALVFVIGFLFSGANTGMQANAAFAYPTQARATGVAWMSGMGRLGNVASGVLGGLMIGAGWSIGQIFLTLGFPPLAGAVAVVTLSVVTRRRAARQGAVHDEMPEPTAAQAR